MSEPGKTTSTRGLAVEALVRIDDGAYAHILVPELLRKAELESRDRALVTDLVYGTVRMRRAVDYLLAPLSSRPLDTLDPQVRAALRLGAFQLLMGIAPHAAVGETVEAVDQKARGYVNGTLRSLTRAGPPWKVPAGDDTVSIGLRTSHPDWIVQTLVDEFGATDALATLRLNDEPPPVTMRVNTTRADVTERYAEHSGWPVHDVRWYEAFACWKTAVILQQLHTRYVRGESTDDRKATKGDGIASQARRAATILDAAGL